MLNNIVSSLLAVNTCFRPWSRIALILLVLLLSACASTQKKTTQPAANDYTRRVVDYALSLQGTPYAYGKASPEEGFDCSGFIWHVYRRHGVALPRTVEQMALALPEVSLNARRPGDLLFFDTNGKLYSHVALYLGGEAFIHAPSSKTGKVMVSGLDKAYWRTRLTAVRRPSASGH